MSDADEVTETPQDEADFLLEERDAVRPLDPELMRLVDFINSLDSPEIGLTLHVGGSVVSGMLISMAQFYRLLINELTDPMRLGENSDPAAAGSFANVFYRPTLESVEKDLQERRESQTPVIPPRHIHMRYAQTYVGGAQPLTQPLWRGRLANVDAWSIGNFGHIPPIDNG